MTRFWTVFLILLPSLALAQDDLSTRVDAYATAYANRGDFSGCLLITEGETTLYENCYGRADFALDASHSMRSRFRIGSVSKQFTAAGVLLLRDRGQLQLEDTLDRWIPEFQRGDEITLHQLLTHTSGVRNTFALTRYPEIKATYQTPEQLMILMLDEPLDFDPGAQHSYSNSGYVLLARILEIESGLPFHRFLKTQVLDPLGLDATEEDGTRGAVHESLATGYDPGGSTGVLAPDFVHPSTTVGAGSVISAAHDLSRWNRKLGEVLSADSLELMRTPHSESYGYGVAIYEAGGKRVVAHDGRVPGFTTDVSYYPEEDVCVVVLSNVQSGIADSFRRDLRRIVFEDASIMPEARELHEGLVGSDDLKRLEGRYSFGPSFVVHAEVRDGALWLAANGGEWSELVPESETRFFSRMLYASVGFQRNEAGAVTDMLWIQDGDQFPGPKLPD